MFTLLTNGLLLAIKLAKEELKLSQVPINFMPLISIFILCYTCNRCCEISKDLRKILLNNPGIAEFRLVEFYGLQSYMQKIEFQPRNFFVFNFEFFLTVVSVVADYDIVFIQFNL